MNINDIKRLLCEPSDDGVEIEAAIFWLDRLAEFETDALAMHSLRLTSTGDLVARLREAGMYLIGGHVEALETDAQRWAGLRLILCEPDPTTRERIIESIDKWMESNAMPTDPPTPEKVNELADSMILVAASARVL